VGAAKLTPLTAPSDTLKSKLQGQASAALREPPQLALNVAGKSRAFCRRTDNSR